MNKHFSFNHNDYVSVTLTKEGAEFLSRKRKQLEVFHEGEIYRTQFWSLVNDFHEMMHIGMQSPFEFGKITVNSSLEK